MLNRQFHTRAVCWLAALMLLVLGAGPPRQPVPPAPSGETPMLIQSERGMVLLEAGREAILDFRLEEAKATFTKLAALPDGDAAAAFYQETISLLKLVVSDKEVYFDEFMTRSDALRDVLGEAADSPWRDFLEAEASLHRAIARAKRGQYMRAALAGRSAYRGYTRLLEVHPDFYDAYKGIGALHVGIGSVSGARKAFLKFLGFGGTVEEGLRELYVAAEKSQFNREEAQVILAQIDMRLFGAGGESGDLLEALWQRHPDSPLMAHLYGSYLYESRQAAAAEQVYQKVADRPTPNAFFYVDYADFYLADALFRQDRFEDAMPYYRRYLERHDGPALKATALLRLGLALEMQGRREEALVYYAKVHSNRDLDSDAMAQRHARHLLHTPLDEQTRTLLLGQNAYDSGRYPQAHMLLAIVIKDPAATHDERAEAAYRQGRLYEAEMQFDAALDAHAAAIAWHNDPASRWGPWSHYYTGLLLEKRGDTAAAKQALEAALAYEGAYDYRQVLERDAKIALDRLGE